MPSALGQRKWHYFHGIQLLGHGIHIVTAYKAAILLMAANKAFFTGPCACTVVLETDPLSLVYIDPLQRPMATLACRVLCLEEQSVGCYFVSTVNGMQTKISQVLLIRSSHNLQVTI